MSKKSNIKSGSKNSLMKKEKVSKTKIPREGKVSVKTEQNKNIIDSSEVVDTRMPAKFIPVVIELKAPEKSILDSDPDVKFSTNIDYSRFSLGFHHYIHSNKNKMEILKQFEGKKKVYLVMNEFERYIDNYEDNIGNISTKYFELKDKPNILSRAFYKLWEIFFAFDIIDVNKENFVSAHLAEGPGSFIQATMFYRDSFCKKGLSKNDKYYAVTLHSEGGDKYVPEVEKEFVSYYEKEKPKRFILHQTYPKQIAGGFDNKDNGDITDPKTLRLFGGDMKERADLITADGGFDWSNENIQEQESFRLILAQIVGAAKFQKKGGTFICKFFETFSTTSAKFIAMLSDLYERVFFIKPYTSRASNSEKYIVCTNFKYSETDKAYKEIIKTLDKLMGESHKKKEMKIVDLFTNYKLSKEFTDRLIQINIEIANRQLKSINEIVKFINDQNFYGDTYQERRLAQIEASKFWINTFLPEKKDLEKNRDKFKEIINYSQRVENNKIKELSKKIIPS